MSSKEVVAYLSHVLNVARRHSSHSAVETGSWVLLGLEEGKAGRRDVDHIALWCVDRSRKIWALTSFPADGCIA